MFICPDETDETAKTRGHYSSQGIYIHLSQKCLLYVFLNVL